MGAPTEEELEALATFREVISDLELSDAELTDDALLKWLRARELDLDKANDMLRRSSQWRVENGIYNILNWKPPESFWKEYYYEICGYTNTGCPVMTLELGKWDFRQIADKHREAWLKYVDLILAKLDDQMKKYSESRRDSDEAEMIESQFIAVLDFDGFSMRQLTSFACLNIFRELVRRYEANYPETLKTVYIINASRVFQYLFKIIKPMLTERTLAKVQVFGSNQEEWKSVLLRNIPADQLGVKFGGTFVPSSSPSSSLSCAVKEKENSFVIEEEPINECAE